MGNPFLLTPLYLMQQPAVPWQAPNASVSQAPRLIRFLKVFWHLAFAMDFFKVKIKWLSEPSVVEGSKNFKYMDSQLDFVLNCELQTMVKQ